MQLLGMNRDHEVNDVATYGQALDTTTNATVYTPRFSPWQGTNFGLHIEYAGGSSLTTVATLWVSDKKNPSEANDNDWVQNDDLTFTNITTGSAAKEEHSVGNGGHRWYRVKFATSNGSGKVGVWVSTRSAR